MNGTNLSQSCQIFKALSLLESLFVDEVNDTQLFCLLFNIRQAKLLLKMQMRLMEACNILLNHSPYIWILYVHNFSIQDCYAVCLRNQKYQGVGIKFEYTFEIFILLTNMGKYCFSLKTATINLLSLFLNSQVKNAALFY